MSDRHDELRLIAKARIGHVLRGKWRLDDVIGVGGMATVYSATHRNGLRGAVKILHLTFSVHPSIRDRFLREGYVANRVGHPGAVCVLDDDVDDDGSCFLVMELLDGDTVGALAEARPERRLDGDTVASMADGMLDVLARAHERGIVHRDIKPENVFVTRAGQVKVLDFGIARVGEISSSATATGLAMGTPAFMSPEQALGKWNEVDARSDVWAVGATMFTLLAGRRVHEADTMNQILMCAMTQPAPPLASVVSGVDPGLALVIDRALAFERDHRWPTAQAMRAELRRLVLSRTARTLGAPSTPTLMGYGEPQHHPGATGPVQVARGHVRSIVLQGPAPGAGSALGTFMGAAVTDAPPTPRRRRRRLRALVLGAALAMLAGATGALAFIRLRHVDPERSVTAVERTVEPSDTPPPAPASAPPVAAPEASAPTVEPSPSASASTARPVAPSARGPMTRPSPPPQPWPTGRPDYGF